MRYQLVFLIPLSMLLFAVQAVAESELVQATPETVSGATTVDTAAAKKLFEDEAAFIDLRKEPAWNAGRIPGSIHLDFKQAFSQKALASEVSKDEAVVFYCSGVRCPRSNKASEMAVNWGYAKVYYYREGFPAWKKAGYPVE
jgi:rhodanese-related sulfurtransferase